MFLAGGGGSFLIQRKNLLFVWSFDGEKCDLRPVYASVLLEYFSVLMIGSSLKEWRAYGPVASLPISEKLYVQ